MAKNDGSDDGEGEHGALHSVEGFRPRRYAWYSVSWQLLACIQLRSLWLRFGLFQYALVRGLGTAAVICCGVGAFVPCIVCLFCWSPEALWTRKGIVTLHARGGGKCVLYRNDPRVAALLSLINFLSGGCVPPWKEDETYQDVCVHVIVYVQCWIIFTARVEGFVRPLWGVKNVASSRYTVNPYARLGGTDSGSMNCTVDVIVFAHADKSAGRRRGGGGEEREGGGGILTRTLTYMAHL